MNRDAAISRLRGETFDVLVIGGGATGAGCALDAATRGYRTALVEAHDFAQGTSSRSTKLIHGGVRYLRQGNVALVREALRERATLLRNAPQLVSPLPFFVPARGFTRAWYALGFSLYDALAANNPLPRTRFEPGGIVYYDAQFDDARLAIALVRTAHAHGAAAANYVRVRALDRDGGIYRAAASDEESGAAFEIRARAVVNAAGVFADEVRALDDASAKPVLRLSRGTHIVVPPECFDLRGRALLVPKTPDRRVLFAIPWMGAVLVGTTDAAAESAEIEPRPTAGEISWLLETIAPYAARPISRANVASCFAGLRPLLAGGAATSRLSREHAVLVSRNGMVSIVGGKWTTYRKMAQDAIDAAIDARGLASRACVTEHTSIDGASAHDVSAYVRETMARTVGDVLARRERTLFVNANLALTQAPAVASELACALGRDERWQAAELRRFSNLAKRYTVSE